MSSFMATQGRLVTTLPEAESRTISLAGVLEVTNRRWPASSNAIATNSFATSPQATLQSPHVFSGQSLPQYSWTQGWQTIAALTFRSPLPLYYRHRFWYQPAFCSRRINDADKSVWQMGAFTPLTWHLTRSEIVFTVQPGKPNPLPSARLYQEPPQKTGSTLVRRESSWRAAQSGAS